MARLTHPACIVPLMWLLACTAGKGDDDASDTTEVPAASADTDVGPSDDPADDPSDDPADDPSDDPADDPGDEDDDPGDPADEDDDPTDEDDDTTTADSGLDGGGDVDTDPGGGGGPGPGVDTDVQGTVDGDGDGWPVDMDCNDSNDEINPGEDEVCDGADNDCDGSIDVDAVDAALWYPDLDGDGYGALSGQGSALRACDEPQGYADNDGDCDDDEPLAWTGHLEFCGDDVDNDCNGAVDEGGLGCSTYQEDADRDGYGSITSSACLCEPTGNFDTTNATDCDDTDPFVYAGIAYEEANLLACMRDADGDGWGDDRATAPAVPGSDCDDNDDRTFPNAAPNDNIFRPDVCERDRDGDGFGDRTQRQRFTPGSDCNDTDGRAYPGQEEGFTSPRVDGSWDFDCDGVESYEFANIQSFPFTPAGWASAPIPDCGNGRELYWHDAGGTSVQLVAQGPSVNRYAYPDVPKQEQLGRNWEWVQSCR